MIIKYQQGFTNDEEKYYTKWFLFVSEEKKYTRNIAEKIKKYLVENVNPELEKASISQFMGWFTGKYDKATYNREYDQIHLERDEDGNVGYKQYEQVEFINIESL